MAQARSPEGFGAIGASPVRPDTPVAAAIVHARKTRRGWAGRVKAFLGVPGWNAVSCHLVFQQQRRGGRPR